MKTPPASEYAETSVLGWVFAHPDQFGSLENTLVQTDFFFPVHGHVFEAMGSVAARGRRPTIADVFDELKTKGLDRKLEAGMATLSGWAMNGSLDMWDCVKLMLEKAALRSVIAACQFAQDEAYEGSRASTEIADELGDALVKVHQRAGARLVRVGERLEAVKASIETRATVRELRGVSSGIAKLDAITSGFLPGQLVVVAARPGQGKTAFALNVCRKLVRKGGSALFVSLEMTTDELVERLLIQEAGIDSSLVRQGDIRLGQWEALHVAHRNLKDAHLYIVDDCHTFGAVAQVARRFRARHPGPQVIVAVDYLQLMKTAEPKGRTRADLVGEISSDMKRLAKSLKLPIMELSQLNRGSESESRQPRKSDLRDSGAIEQDADVILFPYNPNALESGTVDVIVGKNRNGPERAVYAHWNGPTYMFSDAVLERDAKEEER